jgi:hypothetical protein
MTSKKADIIIPENVRTIVTKYILHFNIEKTLLLPENNGLPKEEQVHKFYKF